MKHNLAWYIRLIAPCLHTQIYMYLNRNQRYLGCHPMDTKECQKRLLIAASPDLWTKRLGAYSTKCFCILCWVVIYSQICIVKPCAGVEGGYLVVFVGNKRAPGPLMRRGNESKHPQGTGGKGPGAYLLVGLVLCHGNPPPTHRGVCLTVVPPLRRAVIIKTD